MNKKITLISTLALLTLGTTSFFYWNYYTSPEYSLNELSEAIKNHDNLKFEKYFDKEKISTKFLDQITTSKFNENNKNLFAVAISEIIKTKISNSISKQISNYVSTGDFGNSEELSLNRLSNLTGFNNIKSIKEIKKEGNLSEIVLLSESKRYSTDLEIILRMSKVDSYWKITEISNASSYFDKIEELETSKIDSLNNKIKEQINNTLQISDCHKYPSKDSSYYDESGKEININCNLLNYSTNNIIDFIGNIEVIDKSNQVLQVLNFDNPENKKIQTEDVIPYYWVSFVDELNQNISKLYKLDLEELTFKSNIQSIKFENGTSLEPYTKYQNL